MFRKVGVIIIETHKMLAIPVCDIFSLYVLNG